MCHLLLFLFRLNTIDFPILRTQTETCLLFLLIVLFILFKYMLLCLHPNEQTSFCCLCVFVPLFNCNLLSLHPKNNKTSEDKQAHVFILVLCFVVCFNKVYVPFKQTKNTLLFFDLFVCMLV